VTERPARVVDAHVHLWDPARTDWYPYLSGGTDVGLGDVTGMARRFDEPTYRTESPGWNVEKLVNVAAATGAQSVEETLALDEQAATTGQPAAIVGGITPAAPVAEVLTQIDRQLAAPRFRGVRPMGVADDPVPAPEVLAALRDRDLVFDLMAHADGLRSSADNLAAADGLAVVVEHTGWPRSDTPDEFALWQEGLTALADLGERVTCKLSGLAMPLGAMDADAFAPWIEFAIEAFGVDRCLFASNFPVDGLHGTLDQLWATYDTVTAGLDPESRTKLFATNAERVYRC
jgi:L-fuconolactonase